MFKVKVEGLLDNIIIFENELYFKCYYDSLEEEDVYTEKPYNKYSFDSDSFNTVQLFLYHEDYLGFYSVGNIFNFKMECLKQLSEGKELFKYKGLSVVIDVVEDPEKIRIVN